MKSITTDFLDIPGILPEIQSSIGCSIFPATHAISPVIMVPVILCVHIFWKLLQSVVLVSFSLRPIFQILLLLLDVSLWGLYFFFRVVVETWTHSIRACVSGIVSNYPWPWFTGRYIGLWLLPGLYPPAWSWSCEGFLDDATGWNFIFLNLLVLQPRIHFTQILIGHIYDVCWIYLIFGTQVPKVFSSIFLESCVWKYCFWWTLVGKTSAELVHNNVYLS